MVGESPPVSAPCPLHWSCRLGSVAGTATRRWAECVLVHAFSPSAMTPPYHGGGVRLDVAWKRGRPPSRAQAYSKTLAVCWCCERTLSRAQLTRALHRVEACG